MTPQMKIYEVQLKIDEVEKEINFIKQSWVQNQNQNIKLLDQYNKQFNELNKIRKCKLLCFKYIINCYNTFVKRYECRRVFTLIP